MRCGQQETQRTAHQNSTLNPKWVDTKFDWFKVGGGNLVDEKAQS